LFQLLVNGNKLDSVNASSDKSLAHQESMYELGNVILQHHLDHGPIQ
jgi:hypothetical protein